MDEPKTTGQRSSATRSGSNGAGTRSSGASSSASSGRHRHRHRRRKKRRASPMALLSRHYRWWHILLALALGVGGFYLITRMLETKPPVQ